MIRLVVAGVAIVAGGAFVMVRLIPAPLRYVNAIPLGVKRGPYSNVSPVAATGKVVYCHSAIRPFGNLQHTRTDCIIDD